MSISRTVFVGYYVLAKCSSEIGTEQRLACVNLACKHEPSNSDKYCSSCGGKILTQQVNTTSLRSMEDVKYDEGNVEWVNKLTNSEKKWLTDNFEFISPSTCGIDQEIFNDVLLTKNVKGLDVDYEGAHDLDLKKLSIGPTQKDLERLHLLLKYKNVKVNFGILNCVD